MSLQVGKAVWVLLQLHIARLTHKVAGKLEVEKCVSQMLNIPGLGLSCNYDTSETVQPLGTSHP
jgi:hypothetical protein